MKTEQTIWHNAMKEIENDISREEFLMWFQKVQFQSLKKNIITLEVPSSFYKDQLKQRYLHKIKEILLQLSGEEMEIDLIVQKKNNTTRHSPPPIEKLKRRPEKEPLTKMDKQITSNSLNSEYTFENFVIGDNNRFAANAAFAISKNPGTAYNPCLIYGGVGLGKTHLLQSIGNAILNNYDRMKITYVTAEDFTNSFIRAIQENKTQQFKNKYRHTDILLIDDIHFLQKKHETQEELFHTFNTLFNAKKQMVFTCDRPMNEMKNMTERLQSRFSRGLTVDLQPPEVETAIAILQKKLTKTETSVPEDVIAYICHHITTNIRDLEAALTQVIAYSELVNSEISVSVAARQLKGSLLGKSQANVTINTIIKNISDYFNISVSDLKGKKRSRSVTMPRHIAMYIAREETENSLTDIGLEFGGRDHTTVIHACSKVEIKMRSDPSFADSIQLLVRKILSAKE